MLFLNSNQERRHMNKLILSNIVFLLPLILLADNGACQPPQKMPDGRPAPAASYAKIKDQPSICYGDLQPEAKEHFEHRLNFGLMNLGYERIMPNSTYVGADVKLTPFYNFDSGEKDTLNYFINGELRMGYNNAFTSKDTLIPYAGIGFSVFKFEKKEGKIRDWNYATAGFKYLHQFGEIFEMGINIKAYRSIQEKIASVVKPKKTKQPVAIIINNNNEKLKDTSTKIQDNQGNKLVIVEGKLKLEKDVVPTPPIASPAPEVKKIPIPEIATEKLIVKSASHECAKWMMEVSVPFIWHVGETKNWEILLEPYYMQIPNGKRLHLLGSRLSFGFRF